jgi:hypothetical protein
MSPKDAAVHAQTMHVTHIEVEHLIRDTEDSNEPA